MQEHWIVFDPDFLESTIHAESEGAALALGLARAQRLRRYQVASCLERQGQVLLYKNGNIERQNDVPPRSIK